MDESEQRARAAGARPMMPVIVAFLVGGALLLALGLWVNGRKNEPRSGPAALHIVAPAAGAEVTRPLEVLFQTDAPLALAPMGWNAAGYHLHAMVDGAERMPGAADVTALGSGRFRWTVTGVAPGDHQLQLVWARPDHRSIPEGASGVRSFRVR